VQINEQGGKRERGVTRVVVESAVQKSDRVRAKKASQRKEKRGEEHRERGVSRERGERERERERERELTRESVIYFN